MGNYEHLHWSPAMVQRFWDYESQFPENYFTFQHGRELVRQLRPYIEGRKQILDYGCGPGYLTDELLSAGMMVAGLDFSQATIETAATRFADREGFLGTYALEQLITSELKFDAVIVVEVVEHLYDEQLDELLKTVHSILRENGIAIFTTPNEEVLEDSYILCPETNKLFHRWQHVRNWSRDSLTDYLTKCDFLIDSCFTTNFRTSSRKKRSGTLKKLLKQIAKPRKSRSGEIKKPPHLVAVVRKG